MRGDGDRDRRVDPRQLLDRDRVRQRVGAAAAVLLGDRHAHQPELGHLGDELVREALLAVELLGDRRDLLDRELPHRVADQLVLGRQVEVHGGTFADRRRLPKTFRGRSDKAHTSQKGFSDCGPTLAGAMDPLQHSVETIRTEIERLVAERQLLRESGADEGDLEFNRRRLVRAQAQLSRLLLQRHLPGPAAA